MLRTATGEWASVSWNKFFFPFLKDDQVPVAVALCPACAMTLSDVLNFPKLLAKLYNGNGSCSCNIFFFSYNFIAARKDL